MRMLPPEVQLDAGKHASPADGVCLMEAVAYAAGEPHSDRPKCASPVLAAFGRILNDGLGDGDRQLLRPFIHRLVGTVASTDVERQRAYVLLDAATRQVVPIAMDILASDVAGLDDLAAVLRGLPPLTSEETSSANLQVFVSIGERLRVGPEYPHGVFQLATALLALGDTPAPWFPENHMAADAASACLDSIAVPKSGDESMPIVLATIAAFSRAISVR